MSIFFLQPAVYRWDVAEKPDDDVARLYFSQLIGIGFIFIRAGSIFSFVDEVVAE